MFALSEFVKINPPIPIDSTGINATFSFSDNYISSLYYGNGIRFVSGRKFVLSFGLFLLLPQPYFFKFQGKFLKLFRKICDNVSEMNNKGVSVVIVFV